MTKKQAAYILYLEGTRLEDISSILKLATTTVAKWSSTNKWKQKKNDKLIRAQTTQERITAIFEFQLRVIEKITTIYSEEIDEIDNVTDLKKILVEKGDLDALQKNHTMIRTKEITWDQIVKSTRQLLEHVENKDLALAKKLEPFVNEWLNDKREE